MQNVNVNVKTLETCHISRLWHLSSLAFAVLHIYQEYLDSSLGFGVWRFLGRDIEIHKKPSMSLPSHLKTYRDSRIRYQKHRAHDLPVSWDCLNLECRR